MQLNKSSSFFPFFVFDQVTNWESTDVSTWLSDAQILAHFTVESPWETISPPLKKVLHPSKKIHWILSFAQFSYPFSAISSMREFHTEISSKLFGIVLENQQPIFSRNKRGERTRGFDQRKTQFTRGIDRFFRVYLNRHMGKARYVKRCYWKMVQKFLLFKI